MPFVVRVRSRGDDDAVIAREVVHARAKQRVNDLEALGMEGIELVAERDDRVVAYDPAEGLHQDLVEVERVGTQVAHCRHVFGRRDVTWLVKDYPSVHEAQAAVAHLCTGRVGAASEAEAYLAMAVRHPELERAIIDALDDEEPRLVYADWLMAKGDLRGERLQQAVLGAAAEDHAQVMLGPASAIVVEDRWKGGLLRRARLPTSRRSAYGTARPTASSRLSSPTPRFQT